MEWPIYNFQQDFFKLESALSQNDPILNKGTVLYLFYFILAVFMEVIHAQEYDGPTHRLVSVTLQSLITGTRSLPL